MSRFLALLFFVCSGFWSLDAAAQTTIYYRNCDTGSHASCVNGNNANPGTSPSAPKRSLPDDTAYNNLLGGSNVRVCNGSAYVAGETTAPPSYLSQNSNATQNAPITLEGWDCGDGATGRPIFMYGSGQSNAFVIGGFCFGTCPAPDHGGYVFRGIRLSKQGALAEDSECLVFFGSSRYVLIENMEIDNWANGLNIATDQNVRNLTIRNNYIHDNSQNGVVGSATDLLVEGNYLLRNNRSPNESDSFALEHALYIGGATPQNRIIIRGNILEDNSTRIGTGMCESGNITFRGNVDQVTIEDNVITVPNAINFCFGISVIDGYGTPEECVRRAVIRNNTIVNVGGSGIALRLTAGGIVENNRIIRTVATGQGDAIAIGNPADSGDAAYCPMQNMTVRNNSIYYATSTSGSGIAIAAGAGHKVFNNAVYITSGGAMNCFSHTALGNFSVWNNNWCNSAGNWSPTYANLGLAQAAGFDVNGGNTDPLWLATPSSGNSWSLAVQAGSPLRSVGRNTDKSRFDILGCQRDSSPDVGAHEFGGTPCLTAKSPVFRN